MPSERTKDTEKKIINAARKVFYDKGFKGATMREIAKEANTNLAMVNYYFRSKENLFYIINDETFMALLSKLSQCVQMDVTIEEKITNIIHEYVDFFLVNPHIPSFISGEIIRNPQQIAKLMKEKISKSKIHIELDRQIQQNIEAGYFKPQTSFMKIFTNILSLTIFPILSQPIIKEAFDMDDEAYSQFMIERKDEIAEMILTSIKV